MRHYCNTHRRRDIFQEAYSQSPESSVIQGYVCVACFHMISEQQQQAGVLQRLRSIDNHRFPMGWSKVPILTTEWCYHIISTDYEAYAGRLTECEWWTWNRSSSTGRPPTTLKAMRAKRCVEHRVPGNLPVFLSLRMGAWFAVLMKTSDHISCFVGGTVVME